MIKTVIILSIVTLLTGCPEPQPVKTELEDAKKLVNSMIYVKSDIGVCYGVVSVQRMSSNATVAENQMIVQVDCGKVGL